MLYFYSPIGGTIETVEMLDQGVDYLAAMCEEIVKNKWKWMHDEQPYVTTGDSQGDGGGDGDERANSLRWRDTKDVPERGERGLNQKSQN